MVNSYVIIKDCMLRCFRRWACNHISDVWFSGMKALETKIDVVGSFVHINHDHHNICNLDEVEFWFMIRELYKKTHQSVHI